MGFNWASTITAWQWAALAAVPPLVVALYFLKLKRRPLEVPSTLLWRKSLEDMHVNSLWQRLRRSLLLWLQLLLVAALMVAVGRPSWNASQLKGGRYIFLIDNSASMAATDVQPSRSDEAKRTISDLIDSMGSGDVAMIVAFSDSAQVIQSFTANRQQLHRALAATPQTNRSTSLAEALRVAGGIAGSADAGAKESAQTSAARLYIVSDGRFANIKDFELGNVEPMFIPIGRHVADNQAIVSLAASAQPGGAKSQLYARVANFGPHERSRNVSLYVDGSLADAQALTVPAGQTRGVAFKLNTAGPAAIEIKLDAGDVLNVDDRAWTVLQPPQPANVLLVSPGNEPLALALSTDRAKQLGRLRTKSPGYLQSPEYEAEAESEELDLVIYDRCQPATMPLANTLFIGQIPPGGRWRALPAVSAPQIVDTSAGHPLVRLVELNNVLVAEATPLELPPGGTVLIESNAGPLFAIAPRDAYEDCVLGFEIVQGDKAQTNWPLKVGFPVFALNLLEYFGPAKRQRAGENLHPGEAAVLALPTAAGAVEVKTPSGRMLPVPRGNDRLFRFAGTDELGIYELGAGSASTARFAVDLLDAGESDLAVRADRDVKIGHASFSGQTDSLVGRRETWKWLVLAALAILVVEWYIYNRRVYI